jgi:hypothetical protein
VPGATGYEVFRDEASSPIGTVVGPSYGDAGLKPATTYRYKVRAITGGTKSDLSAVIAPETRRKVPLCEEPGTCAVR